MYQIKNKSGVPQIRYYATANVICMLICKFKANNSQKPLFNSHLGNTQACFLLSKLFLTQVKWVKLKIKNCILNFKTTGKRGLHNFYETGMTANVHSLKEEKSECACDKGKKRFTKHCGKMQHLHRFERCSKHI